jgi:hypothetical protein
LLLVGSACGQTKLSPEADQLYKEALGLHIQAKHAEALDRLKQAIELAPENQRLQSYQADLRQEAARQLLYEHALKAPASAEATIEKLAAYLIKPAKSDEDKARLIYRWVTDRISYDVEALRTGKTGDNTAKGVLKNRKGVCEGYARLYEALGKAAGVETAYITGVAKGAGYGSGRGPGPHAWNAVKLNGQWRLLDATFGAGVQMGEGYVKNFRETTFLVPPEQMALTHLPAQPGWQLLASPVKDEQFMRWPKVRPDLFALGFQFNDAMALLKRDVKGLAEPMKLPKGTLPIKFLAAPLDGHLKVGETYTFRIEAHGLAAMAVGNGSKTELLTGSDGIFEGKVTATESGILFIAGRALNEDGNSFWGILRYEVE